jgi:hypothetical protein
MPRRTDGLPQNIGRSYYSSRQRVIVLTFADSESATAFDGYSNEEIYDAIYEALEWLSDGIEQYS